MTLLRCAAFGVPSQSADASLLLAWLSRNMAMPAGCVLSMPADLPQSINEHVAHLLQRLIKVPHRDLTSHASQLQAPGANLQSCRKAGHLA